MAFQSKGQNRWKLQATKHQQRAINSFPAMPKWWLSKWKCMNSSHSKAETSQLWLETLASQGYARSENCSELLLQPFDLVKPEQMQKQTCGHAHIACISHGERIYVFFNQLPIHIYIHPSNIKSGPTSEKAIYFRHLMLQKNLNLKTYRDSAYAMDMQIINM